MEQYFEKKEVTLKARQKTENDPSLLLLFCGRPEAEGELYPAFSDTKRLEDFQFLIYRQKKSTINGITQPLQVDGFKSIKVSKRPRSWRKVLQQGKNPVKNISRNKKIKFRKKNYL